MRSTAGDRTSLSTVLGGSKPPKVRTWQDDEKPIDSEAETGSARNPDAVLQLVECGEALIVRLFLPAVQEDENVADVEPGQAQRSEQVPSYSAGDGSGGDGSRTHRRFQTSLRPVSSLLTRVMNVICTAWASATAQPVGGGTAGEPKVERRGEGALPGVGAAAGLQETRRRIRGRVVVP